MTTAENIRAWFISCPTIEEISSFNTNYLSDDATECTIYTMPSSLTYTEDVLGNIFYNKRQKLNFMLAIRMPYGDDVNQNLLNLSKFDDIIKWMYEQNLTKNLPVVEEGEVVSIVPTKTPSAVSANADTIVYELMCSLSYDRVDV